LLRAPRVIRPALRLRLGSLLGKFKIRSDWEKIPYPYSPTIDVSYSSFTPPYVTSVFLRRKTFLATSSHVRKTAHAYFRLYINVRVRRRTPGLEICDSKRLRCHTKHISIILTIEISYKLMGRHASLAS